MPKGKGQRDYEREIEETAKRMRKHPEHLRAARDSEDWIEFLLDVVGVNPQSTTSPDARDFWEKVREKDIEQTTTFTPRRLAEARVELVTGLFRDARGQFTSEVTDKPVVSFRSKETGRFVSRKSTENSY